MSRPSRALIDVHALRKNYRLARQLHGGRALAVLKANAYGHGAVACARALEATSDGFAVAFLDEAIQLRHAGIGGPILVLEGCFTRAELIEAHAHKCWVAVHQEEQLRALEQAPSQVGGMHAWVKFDSGMRRAGFPLSQAKGLAQRLQGCDAVSRMTLMSHFARADEPESEATAIQIAAFDTATAGISAERSLANSAGLLAWPAAKRDWSRPGIMLYGVDPLPGSPSALSPVMTLESEVFAMREIEPGDALGYGAHYVAAAPRRVGIVAIGYADGYPRTVPQGTPVMVGAHRGQVIGRVSMDMLTIDLTDVPGEGVGSRVELWGRNISVNDVASAIGTIGYELLCHVQRVPRIYEDAR
ncbi:alanine racemase [Variovorax guangxiensis]|uniref:alanine racemase n=1 Tax=Variovorax guangxiensis TaxID=1775474 RepID=UPI0028561BDE|nr:alanine racemase [Variovorax guangxiensis]MDR6861390.1 alanine racemase [Variovorax guangxiensis]